MTVAIIGVDEYVWTTALAIRAWRTLAKLVVREGANIFLFNNGGQFDRECWTIVSQLKTRHSEIERHYHHGGCDYDVGYVDYISEFYDKVVFPQMGIPLRCYLRDRQMIDKCDVLVTWCLYEDLHAEQKNPAALAILYAQYKKKRVINLYQ